MSEVLDEGGVVEPQDAPVEEPAAEAAPEPPATPAEPTLDPFELQAELDHTRQQLTELYSLLEQSTGQPEQQAAAQAAAPQFTDEYGNFDSAAFAQYMQQNNQALVQQIAQQFQPIQQTFQQQQEAAVVAEGEQRLQDILADDVARNGEFASDPEADAKARELVSTLAAQIFPEIADRYGANPRAAEIAMSRAATEVRSLLHSVGGSAVSQTQNQLAALAEAKGEPGAHGAGVEAPVIRVGANGQPLETSASKFANQAPSWR